MNPGASHWRGSLILPVFIYISVAIIANMWYNIENRRGGAHMKSKPI